MDMQTLGESVVYRCFGRGEDYEAFVTEYVTREELLAASLSVDEDEHQLAKALLELLGALGKIDVVMSRIAPRPQP